MQITRVAKCTDAKTGSITLHGSGADRLIQAMESGLVAETLKSDVEAVLSENSFLRKRLKIASDDARREARKASSLRRDRLERYMRENELRKVRRSLSEVALGCLALGVALGSAIMSIALAILMKG